MAGHTDAFRQVPRLQVWRGGDEVGSAQRAIGRKMPERLPAFKRIGSLALFAGDADAEPAGHGCTPKVLKDVAAAGISCLFLSSSVIPSGV